MAFGTLGSTLNDELNRLANGGTYRDKDAMVDEALAAKQWANRENIVPYSTDTVGVLNEIAALGPNRQNWFDFNGVCNYLAGTTGLPAAAALRQITTTGDILTSLAGFYTDAATPRYNYPGFIRLDGTLGNYISTPDETALDITGDLDLRIKLAADAYTTSGAFQTLIAKTDGGSNQSYGFGILNTGVIRLFWSANGSASLSADSTVATGLTNGSTKWIRVTLDVNNGASGRDIKFFLSDNGTTWTQLGATVTQAGTTSIFNSTRALEIGSQGGGGSSLVGNIFNAQIFASIDGTDKRLDVDLTTNVTSATYDQFTATTGQLCTINGQNTLTNGGSAGALLPITVGSSLAADSNDAKFLAHDGTNYVYTTGVTGNGLVVPDSAALDITGDIDLRAQIAMDDWTDAGNPHILSKYDTIGNQISYALRMLAAGNIRMIWTTDGSTIINKDSTAVVPFADGTAGWIRATLDVNNTASGNDVKFYTSTDGTNWTQLGATVTTAGTTSIFSGSSTVSISGFNSVTSGSGNLAGKIYRAQIFNGIDGTKVLDVDTSVITSGADTYVVPTTYTGQAGAYFTGSGLSLNGVAGNYVSTPDSTPLDITGDIDVQVKVALDDWTPATQARLIDKVITSGVGNGYAFDIQTNGRPIFYWSPSGTSYLSRSATAAPTVTDGQPLWVRATLDVDNGASGHTVTFYTSTDGTTWTVLGTPVVTAGTTSIGVNAAPIQIGQSNDAALTAKGTFYRVEILSGINGYPVFDADFTQVPANALRMTESSINKAVVTLNTTRYATINRSTSGRKTVAVTQPTWLFGTDDYMEVNNRWLEHTGANYLYLPGVASNYASAPDSAALDIVGDIDLRVKVALDDWTLSQRLLTKDNIGAARSYGFQMNAAGNLIFEWFDSTGTYSGARTSTVATGVSDGSTKWIRVTLDVDNGSTQNETKFFTSDDGTTWTQLGTTLTVAGVTSINNTSAIFAIGSTSAGTVPARGKFFRAQVLNGIGGTVAFDANFEGSITSLNQASFTESSSNAATVTINRSGSTYRSAGVIDAGYLYPGATNTFSNSTIDYLNFGATDSMTAVVVVRNWTTLNGAGRFLNKEATAGYRVLDFTNSGAITDGTNTVGAPTANQVSGALETWGFVANRSTNTIATVFNGLGSTASISTVGSLSNINTLRIGSTSAGTLFANMELIGAAIFRQALTTAQIRQVTNYFANREAYL